MGKNQIGNNAKNQTELWLFGFPDYAEFHDKKDWSVKTMERKEMPKIDYTEYVGSKVTTDNAEIVKTKFGLAINVSATVDAEKKVRANTLFSFQFDDEDRPYVGVGTKLDKFLTSKGVDPADIPEEMTVGGLVPALMDVPVVVQMNAKTGYLELI